jgi:hypothetical protein
MQIEGVEFSETFAPVGNFASTTLQITAFLNPDVREEMYVQFPEGIGVPQELQKNKDTKIAFRFKKGLSGLRQSP